jgi:hypothetical protein
MNIHSDYQADRETTVTFSLENGNKLRLEFHDNSRCVLTTESPNRISSTAQFKKAISDINILFSNARAP